MSHKMMRQGLRAENKVRHGSLMDNFSIIGIGSDEAVSAGKGSAIATSAFKVVGLTPIQDYARRNYINRKR